jgi:hypothetical protein
MKKQMKRTVYEAPVTERFQVELEGTMMSASIYEDKTHQEGVSSAVQEYDSFDGASGVENDGNGHIVWK